MNSKLFSRFRLESPAALEAVLAPREPGCFGLLPGGLRVGAHSSFPVCSGFTPIPLPARFHPRGELSFQHHGERAQEGLKCCRAAALSGSRPVLGSCPLESRTPQPPRLPCSLTAAEPGQQGPCCPQPGSALPARGQHRPGGPRNRLSHCRAPGVLSEAVLLLFQLPPPPRATPPGELGPRLLPRAAAGGALQSHPSARP